MTIAFSKPKSKCFQFLGSGCIPCLDHKFPPNFSLYFHLLLISPSTLGFHNLNHMLRREQEEDAEHSIKISPWEEKMTAVDWEQTPKSGQEFNWAGKYHPKTLMDFICHRDIAEKLETLARIQDIQYGGQLQLLVSSFFSVSKGGPISSIQIQVQVSSEHIEVGLSGLKGYAAEVVMMLIKLMSKNLKQTKFMRSYKSRRLTRLKKEHKRSEQFQNGQ